MVVALAAGCSGGGGPTSGGSGGNEAPIAHAGPGRGVEVRELTSLDGRASSDPEHQLLTYAWSIRSKPSGSSATLSGHATATPTLVPDMLGEYVLELVVSDGDKESAPALTTVVADHGATHRVGPGRTFETPSACAAVAGDGDYITIDATEYVGDVAVWRANNLDIRGVGGRAHIVGDGASAQGKALWVVQGANVSIKRLEFSGATVKDENGSGIRAEGAGLNLRECSFHDNESGVLISNNPSSLVLVESCEFARNGFGHGQTHNLYVNKVKSLTVLFSRFEHVNVGHHIKSRAERTTILYNRLIDADEGSASYAIEMPHGGKGVVVGNQIHKGVRASNTTCVAFGAEGLIYPVNELHVANNTFVNDTHTGPFVKVWTGGTAKLCNNLFVGAGAILSGLGTSSHDLQTQTPEFVDRENQDYSLRPGSPAIDAGRDPGFGNGLPLTPIYEFDKIAGVRPRVTRAAIDLGALEYVATP